MATFTGTDADETITVGLVSSTVVSDPTGALPTNAYDEIHGGGGNDQLYGSHGGDLLDGGDGNDTLTGGRQSGRLLGGAGADSLKGGKNGDLLDGGTGVDTMAGGTGSDTYIVDNAGDVVTELEASGVEDKVYASISYQITDYVEHLFLTGLQNLAGTGNDGRNTIVGNAGDNILSGLLGEDWLYGGNGRDALQGDDGEDRLYGEAGNDTLYGGAGNDRLDGGTGADIMHGGAGVNSYFVDNVGDIVVEDAANIGGDVTASISYVAAARIEGASLSGTAAIDATGNDGDNWLSGNDGDNVLSGMEGNDRLYGFGGHDILLGGAGDDELHGYLNAPSASDMDGGAGNDTYWIASVHDTAAEDGITGGGIDTVISSVSFTLAASLENLTLSAAFFLPQTLDGTGNALDNLITGNAAFNILSGLGGRDTLIGGDGIDTLDGGADADRLEGGAGDDLYIVTAGDTVVEAAGGGSGNDTVQSTASFVLSANVENLTLTGSEALDGTGNNLRNLMKGNSGNNVLRGMSGDDTINAFAGDDTIDGGLGADDMGGGLGADLYIVDNAGDIAEESYGDGAIDTVQAAVRHTLSKNIENLTLTGTGAIDGTGNVQANAIVGNDAANVLNGKGGADTLTGGDGTDTFLFDTPLVAGVVTTITDFVHGVDKIALSLSVFSKAASQPGPLAHKPFAIGSEAAAGADRIIYNATTGDLIYDPDGNRRQPGTVFATLSPGLDLNSTDFTLV